jgi:hypothetical protein
MIGGWSGLPESVFDAFRRCGGPMLDMMVIGECPQRSNGRTVFGGLDDSVVVLSHPINKNVAVRCKRVQRR